MIAIVAALKQEMAGVKSRMKVEHVQQGRRCRCYYGRYEGREVALAFSGMGRSRAEEAADMVLGIWRPEALVSIGFGGALRPGLRVGDIVVCAETCAAGGVIASDAGLVSAIKDGLRVGRGTTAPGVVAGPEEKQRLAVDSGADVVDMEGYWVGARAAARGVPFLHARAVSDTASERLASLEGAIDAEGKLRLPQAFRLLVRPGSMVRLPRLLLNSRKAASSITDFVDRLVLAM